MFDSIFLAIETWMRGMLTSMVDTNLAAMFTEVNAKTASIASQVGRTPQGWNGSIFSMIRNLSNSVVMPIAGLIIYFVKMWIAVYILSHTFTITMAVFDVGQHVVNSASGVIGGSTAIDITALTATIDAAMVTMEIGELVLLAIELFIARLCLQLISILITVILYSRMIEIYLYVSVSPIPFATLANREWGQVGNNYLRGLFALAFQGFFMMVCVGIYAALVSSVGVVGSNLHTALLEVMAYTVLLCFALMRTGSLSRQIFGAH